MDWEPIETAPRDGTVILLSRGHDVWPGWYAKGKAFPWCHIDDTKFVLSGCCDDEEEGRIEPNAWRDNETGPRYWMSLPKGPDVAAPLLEQKDAEIAALRGMLENVIRAHDSNSGYEPSASVFARAVDNARAALASPVPTGDES